VEGAGGGDKFITTQSNSRCSPAMNNLPFRRWRTTEDGTPLRSRNVFMMVGDLR
jgi:hypothetical protein